MFVVTEEDEAAIRIIGCAVYEQRGEFAAAVELRQRFPGITDNAQARECARTIAGWRPLQLRTPKGRDPYAEVGRVPSATQSWQRGVRGSDAANQ